MYEIILVVALVFGISAIGIVIKSHMLTNFIDYIFDRLKDLKDN